MNNFFKNINDDSNLEVSLTPLIDTVLDLLIIFIISMPIVHQSIKISLPNGSTTE
jgi:biopolymer transport protein ExbD